MRFYNRILFFLWKKWHIHQPQRCNKWTEVENLIKFPVCKSCYSVLCWQMCHHCNYAWDFHMCQTSQLSWILMAISWLRPQNSLLSPGARSGAAALTVNSHLVAQKELPCWCTSSKYLCFITNKRWCVCTKCTEVLWPCDFFFFQFSLKIKQHK